MTDTHDVQVTQLLKDIQDFLKTEDMDIVALGDAWDLHDGYAALLKDHPEPHLDLTARVARIEDTLTQQYAGASAAVRLEESLELYSAFTHRCDWDRSKFLTDTIFAAAKEIGPQEEQELASVFHHIAEGIKDEKKAGAYRTGCVAAAYRHGNINVAVEMSPDMQRLEEIGLSGSFIRHTLGATDARWIGTFPAMPPQPMPSSI